MPPFIKGKVYEVEYKLWRGSGGVLRAVASAIKIKMEREEGGQGPAGRGRWYGNVSRCKVRVARGGRAGIDLAGSRALPTYVNLTGLYQVRPATQLQ